MTVVGLKPIHLIDHSTGVPIHVQNVQSVQDRVTAYALYGMDYTAHFLKAGLYKGKPHHNLPVMETRTPQELRAVLTLDNARQNQVLSSNAHKDDVLLGLEWASNLISPGAKAGVVGAGVVLNTVSRGGKLVLVSAPPRGPTAYARWLTRPDGLRFTDALATYADNAHALLKKLSATDVASRPTSLSALAAEFNALRRPALTHAKAGADFVEDLSGPALAAVKEVDDQFLKGVDRKLIEQGHFLSNTSFPFKQEDTLSLVALRLDKTNQLDHQYKMMLLRQDRVHELAPTQQTEFKVWQADPGLFYRARQQDDFGSAQRFEAAVLLEEFKSGLAAQNFAEKLALLRQKISTQKTPAQERLHQLTTEAKEINRQIEKIKKDLNRIKVNADWVEDNGMNVSFNLKEQARLEAALADLQTQQKGLQHQWKTTRDIVESQAATLAQIDAQTLSAAEQIVSPLRALPW